jgi:hypothetical protein
MELIIPSIAFFFCGEYIKVINNDMMENFNNKKSPIFEEI